MRRSVNLTWECVNSFHVIELYEKCQSKFSFLACAKSDYYVCLQASGLQVFRNGCPSGLAKEKLISNSE